MSANVFNCGMVPRCGSCTRCRKLEQSVGSLDEPGLVVPPAFPVASIGGLYGNSQQHEADARRRETDRLLEKHGLKPRRW